MGTREELEHKTKIRKKKKQHYEHTAYATDSPAFEILNHVTHRRTQIYVHILYFFNSSSHKPPDINIFKNINMTIHKSAHSSNVFTWHQKWKLHIWTQNGHIMDKRCNLTNK